MVTVQGWVRFSGGDKEYTVISPMLMWNGEPLEAQTITFTQNNSTGTRTTLELKNPAAIQQGRPGLPASAVRGAA
jgi:hypothetical protein